MTARPRRQDPHGLLVALRDGGPGRRCKDRFDVAFGNDADADRHGIVTPAAGLMNPNHYLAVAIAYLFAHRPGWRAGAAVGKTLVSQQPHRSRGARLGRRLVEVPVGFKWFVDGLLDGSLGFGGEESAGASFLRRDGSVLDHRQGRHHPGPARRRDHARVTGQDPGEHYERARARSSATRLHAHRRAGDARPRRPRSKKLVAARR